MKMKRKKVKWMVPCLLLASLIGAPAYSVEQGAIESLRQTSKAFAAVAREVSPAVVFVQVESEHQGMALGNMASPFGDELFRRFFGQQFQGFPGHPRQSLPKRKVTGQGSGFVFKHAAGKSYILTNNHVVDGADKIKVTFQDGEEYEARVTGSDPKSDIAILELNNVAHPALALGDSTRLDVGEWVVAVGNPFGLNHTLTVGVVSAKGRSGLGINDYEDFIQTDAAINPGNSGGPLVNLDGEVIGINTAIFSRSGGYMGVGFAIPIDLAKNIAAQLIDNGEVSRGYLGVVIQALTSELAQSLELGKEKGILVAQVSADSPAQQAGLKVGDLIVAYQGKKVTEVADFRNRVALTSPGSRAELTVVRDGKHKNMQIKIGDLSKGQPLAEVENRTVDEIGLSVRGLTADQAEQYGVDQGVVVTQVQPGTVASMAGIHAGAVISQVNRQPVASVEQFAQALQQSRASKRVLLLISERGMSRYLVLSW